MAEKLISPLHPGEVLMHEFLEPLNLSQNQLAQDIGVSPRRINEIVNSKRSITADTALRLAKYFQMSPQFWLGLQMDYELDLEKDRLSDILAKEVKVRPIKKVA
ncbi:MAG: HigA family addiction module antitoxin [Candidatus Rifleibacteriota bacterium]